MFWIKRSEEFDHFFNNSKLRECCEYNEILFKIYF
jgi:hypothetical protein